MVLEGVREGGGILDFGICYFLYRFVLKVWFFLRLSYVFGLGFSEKKI